MRKRTSRQCGQPGNVKAAPILCMKEIAAMSITIYHNPRCSKSRQTLALLQEKGIEPEVRLYLEEVPTADELEEVILKLGSDARSLLRTNEKLYKSLELSDSSLTDQALITAMTAHPELIERPIVINGDDARIGRPPEAVLEILEVK
jgi:arsenate reductase